MDQHQQVNKQFGEMAKNYLASNVHAIGQDLTRLTEMVSLLNPVRALDLGCGAGHASFALAAGGVSSIAAYDLSKQMLAVVKSEALARGYIQIATQQGSVERLPYPDNHFDFVVTRFSAHHWPDMHAALKEIRRVCTAQAKLVVIDVIAPEVPLFDTILQTIELLRDPSHTRDYRITEWQGMLGNAGFAASHTYQWKLYLDFKSWIGRMNTSGERVHALEAIFSELPTEAKTYFGVKDDLSFACDAAWIESNIAN